MNNEYQYPPIAATPVSSFEANMQPVNPWLLNQPVPTNNPTDLLAQQHRQLAIIGSTGYATGLGLEMAAAIHERGLATYDVSVGRVLAYRDRPRDQEHQALVDAYAAEGLHILKRDLRAIEMVGVMQIAQHVGRELIEGNSSHMR